MSNANAINLLLQKDDKNTSGLSNNVTLLRFVMLFFVFVVPLTTITLFLLIFFSPLADLQKEEKDLIANSAAIQTKAAKVAFINDRLQKAAVFITAQDKYDTVMQKILQLVSADITITGLKITSQDMSFSAGSASLLSLKNYRQSILAEKTLTNVTLGTIGINADGTGGYTMLLTMQIHE